MRIYNLYIIFLLLAAGLLNVVMAFLKVSELSIYFVVNALAYLIISILYVHFNPRARSALRTIAAVLASGFIVIIAIQLINLASRSR